MEPSAAVHAVDVPRAEEAVPGSTELLVRSILGDEAANEIERHHPGRITIYCDIVRTIISTLYTMGAVEGEDCRPVVFPDGFMGLGPAENRLLLKGLVLSGRLVGSESEGYRLSRTMFLGITPGSERTH